MTLNDIDESKPVRLTSEFALKDGRTVQVSINTAFSPIREASAAQPLAYDVRRSLEIFLSMNELIVDPSS